MKKTKLNCMDWASAGPSRSSRLKAELQTNHGSWKALRHWIEHKILRVKAFRRFTSRMGTFHLFYNSVTEDLKKRWKKEKPDNRSGLFHTCAPENLVREHADTVSFALFPASHQFWGQRTSGQGSTPDPSVAHHPVK